ncbi:pentatricopeptide repeat-containing protein [Tanacetum coccineum]
MHLCNAIMVMYGRCGRRWDGVKLFDEMCEQDVVSWTGRIGVAFDCWDAFEVFKCCLLSGCEVNEFTLINVLASVKGGKMVDMRRQVHAIVWKGGFLDETSVCNVLISMYGKSGRMDDARCVFDEIVYRDSVSWNSMISGYSQHRLSNQAIELFSSMRNSLLQPNEYTLLSIFEVLSDSKWVLQIHSLILKLRFISTDLVLYRLITSYAKFNAISYSRNIFGEIDSVHVIHVNAMLGAYDHCRCYSDVQTLFYRRWNSSLNVDTTTFNIVLKSCAALSDLHQGKSLHSLAIKTTISADKCIESAVIDVYSKCGSIEDAEHVFQNANIHNLVSWNSMIMGYAQFGCYSKAYDLLTKIREFGMKPDEITYLGILSSCSCWNVVVGLAHYD